MKLLKQISKFVMALFYVGAGANHFINPQLYLDIMPPVVPFHRGVVAITGVAEIVLGLLIVFPRTQRIASWGLILLLIAIYPANVYMALNHRAYPDVPLTFHFFRLPMQFVLIAWAYWHTRTSEQLTSSQN